MSKKRLTPKRRNNNPTTNYPKDAHKEFCNRCYGKHRGNCPKTGTIFKDEECTL